MLRESQEDNATLLPDTIPQRGDEVVARVSHSWLSFPTRVSGSSNTFIGGPFVNIATLRQRANHCLAPSGESDTSIRRRIV